MIELPQYNTTDELMVALAEGGGDLICQCPDHVYDEAPGVRQSNLEGYEDSPAHYKVKANSKHTTTPAKLVGSVAHEMMFYGEGYVNDAYAIKPKHIKADPENEIEEQYNPRSNKGKQELKDWAKDNEHKLIIGEPQLAEGKMLAGLLSVHPVISAMFSGGYAEVACFTSLHGVQVKCKLDYWHPDKALIVDLKTSGFSLSAFHKSVDKYNYDVQAYSYSAIVENILGQKQSFVFVAIEKFAPHGIKRKLADRYCMERGQRKYLDWLYQHKHCLEANHWPNYSIEVEEITPLWMRES